MTANLLILAGGARLLARLRDLGLDFRFESKWLASHVADKDDGKFVLPNYFDRETLEFGRLGKGGQVVLSDPGAPRLIEKKWGKTLELKGAFDCYAPGRLGVAGQVPGHPRMILATGWGGTAFKFALEIGNRAANSVEQAFPESRMIDA